MKIVGDESYESVSGGEAISMQMAVTGAGFALNIDKLYTNKIESVIREICSNARDAMVSAGRGHIPFEIYLPSDLNPYLVIRDTGTGMNKADAIKYLSTLYQSSKAKENDSVGAYGIGSKSPFAISDSYTIESIFNGVKYSFQFFRSGKNLPKLLDLGEEEVDELNGITFKILVKETDRQRYLRAIETQMFNFNPKPKIDGVPYSLGLPRLEEESGMMKIYRSSVQRNFFGACSIAMGGVTYPISLKEFESPLLKSMVDRLQNDQIIVLEVPIGSVEVPGDRERIEYTDHTVKFLNEALVSNIKDITDKAVTEIIAELKEKDSFAHAVWAHQEFSSKYKHVLYGQNRAYDHPDLNINISISFESVADFVSAKGKPIQSVDFNFNEDGDFRYISVETPHYVSRYRGSQEYAGPTKDGEPLYMWMETYHPVYKISKSVRIGADSLPRASGWENWSSTSPGAIRYSMAYTSQPNLIFLVDDEKNIGKKIASYIAGNNEKYKITIVRCDLPEKNFTPFIEYIDRLTSPDSNIKFVRLSSIVLDRAQRKAGVRKNASGIRVQHISHDYGERSSLWAEKLSTEKMVVNPDYIGYFDTKLDTAYVNQNHSKRLNEDLLNALLGVSDDNRKTIYLMSHTANKRERDTFLENDAIDIADVFTTENILKRFGKYERDIYSRIIARRLFEKTGAFHKLHSEKLFKILGEGVSASQARAARNMLEYENEMEKCGIGSWYRSEFNWNNVILITSRTYDEDVIEIYKNLYFVIKAGRHDKVVKTIMKKIVLDTVKFYGRLLVETKMKTLMVRLSGEVPGRTDWDIERALMRNRDVTITFPNVDKVVESTLKSFLANDFDINLFWF